MKAPSLLLTAFSLLIVRSGVASDTKPAPVSPIEGKMNAPSVSLGYVSDKVEL